MAEFNGVYTVCKVCFDRSGGSDTTLAQNTCFSTVEHVNKERIQVTVLRDGAGAYRLVPAQGFPPLPPFRTPLLQSPQIPSSYGPFPPPYHQHSFGQLQLPLHPPPYPPVRMNPMVQPFIPHFPPNQYQPVRHFVGPAFHSHSPQVISSSRNLSSRVPRPRSGTYQERKSNPPPLSDTQLPMTLDNYRKKFKALLYYEEEEHISLLAKNCNGHYQISLMDQQQYEYQEGEFDSYFIIHGLSPSQILYASQASSEVHINCPPHSVKGKILRNYEHDRDILCFGVTGASALNLMEKLSIVLEENKFEVKFEVKHSYFNSLHRSLNEISKDALRRIIPSPEDFQEGLKPSPKSNFPVNELDVFQSNALQTMAFSKSNAPVLIPGPFGSGKTRLLAVAAQYFSRIAYPGQKSRILLCCCQQDSADIFMRDYFLKMLKDGWNNVEVVRIASEVHRRGQLSHHVILLNKLNEKLDYYRSVNHLLVITTFMTALRLPDFFPPGFFTHILIDEGAQAREPECIAPLCLANKTTRIIIAGDSKQVGPKLAVLGKIANENGLGVSLLERLHKSYAEIELAKFYTVMLYNNYRCLPEILDLPSSLFYESALNACAKVPRIKKYPLKFICSSESDFTMSLCENVTEAKIIIQEVETLINEDHIDTTGICIMSPSQRQVSLIRKELRLTKIRGIKVLSSYQMQGQEFDVLLLSTVEYISTDGRPFDPLKSLCQPAVFNTAITRARSLVIAVGNPSTLVKAEELMGSSFRCWNHFIARCKANGTYIKCDSGVKRKRLTLDDTAVVKKPSDKLMQMPRDDSRLDITQPLSFSPNSKKEGTNSSGVSEVKPLSTETNDYKTNSKSSNAKSLPSHQRVVRNYSQRRPKGFQSDRNTGKPPVHRTLREETTFYEEEFPTLEASRELPKKEPKKAIKNSKPTVVDPQGVSKVQQSFNPDVLKSALTSQNYKERFHCLLALEEEEHERILLNKCDGLYSFCVLTEQNSNRLKLKDRTKDHIRIGYINAKHLDGDKISYAKQASEGRLKVTFVDSHSKRRNDFRFSIVGTEFAKGEEKIYLGLEISDVLLLKNCLPLMIKSEMQCEVTVKFEFKHSYFDRLHRAVDLLLDEVISRKLIPNNYFNFSADEYGHQSTSMESCVKEFVNLDRSEGMPHNPQMLALHKILNCDSSKAPMLIIGSFGTGKTRLLARAAYQILRNNKKAKVLVCAHHQKSIDTMLENYFGEMIEAGWHFTGALIRLIPSEGYYDCKPQFSKYYKRIHEIKGNFDRKSIRLVLTTFSSALSLYYYMRRDFTHILIDEGAQSREPESIIPLCLASAQTTIVIAGDHMQVGPAALVLGEEARENGLKVSLLERLHSLYSREELSEAADSHCVTLLTNFRSHHALLSLPSYLFYGSALVTVAEATTQLHPDAHYPLHFVCSSLNEETVEVTDSYNAAEVVKVLGEVRRYVKNWPHDIWGQKNLKDICIMATTPNQKSYFVGELRKPYNRDINGVEVLTVYDIQGQEFQAVFLSTAEPTYQNGMSKNPTKSPCGQYVFNTALTRAKSLFVGVGNPFLLLKVEEKMRNERNFWRDFMKRCIISKTFHIHETDLHGRPITEVYKNLQILIFSKYADLSHRGLLEESLVNNYDDPIIKRLQEFVRRRPQFQRCKLQIYRQQSDQIWDIVNVTINRNHEEEKLNFTEKVDCELLITTRRSALGVPISSKQDSIVINGLKNRRGAFHGDIVTIGVLGEHKKTGQKYGKVIKLKEGRHSTKYVCTADKQNIINFYPIDKLEPAIVNLPKISRYNLQYKREVFEQSQKNYITVFEESSLNLQGDVLPIIKELIPLEMASSLLFVVKVLSWSPEYRKPLGAVIDALPRTNSIFIMEKLLTVAHEIHEDESVEVELEIADDIEPMTASLSMYECAFTIDPSTAINLDDALSVIYLTENTVKVSVLISDVAKTIKQNSKLDHLARQRGTTVYGLECTAHMLPVGFTRSKLSLLPEQCRNVIAVSAIVNLRDKKIVTIDESSKPENAQMRSFVRLTYEDAQRILNGEKVALLSEEQKQYDTKNSVKLKDALKLLFDIAIKLRIDRVGDAAYCSDASELDEEINWQSHLLVSELMIWANKKIAEFLYDNIPDLSVFRRQLPPLPKEMEKIQQTYKDAFMYSLSLALHSVPDDESVLDDEASIEQLLIPSSICTALKDAFNHRDLATLRNLLSDNNNYPQLAIAQSAVRSISQRAEYIKGVSEKEKDADMFYGHHQLRVDHYTHFTSPMRRYPDIIIQRLVNALISNSDILYTENELQKLCTYFNRKLKSANKFEKDIKKLDLANSCENSLDKLEVYLTKSLHKEHKFEICIPSVKYRGVVLAGDTHFDQSQLNCLRRQGVYTTWRVISVPFQSPDFLFHPMISQFNKCSESDSTALGANQLVHASIFNIVEGEENKDSRYQRRKKISYIANIQDEALRIDLDKWRLCNEFVKKYTLESDPACLAMLEELQALVNRPSATIPEVVPEFLHSPVICYDTTRNFSNGETVNVWMGKSMKNPISSPGIHLIEVAPSVKVCLQHNKSPAMCFSDTQLRLTSKSSYNSISEYVNLWCKALLAEASHDAVDTKSLVLLKDVPLVWPELIRPDNCLDNVHFKPKSDLILSIDEEKLGILDFVLKVKIRPGDLVCARYSVANFVEEEDSPPKEAFAVYHFVIQTVKTNDDDSKEVFMRPVGEHGCRVSLPWMKILKSNPPSCELQIIKMPDSFNRLFRRLLSMENKNKSKDKDKWRGSDRIWSNLAVNVALGQGFLQVQENYSEILRKNPNSFRLWNDKSKMLNSQQIKAIQRALNNRFSLIQGPPGTGKSIVGAHLAYTFAMGNRQSRANPGCVIYCGPSNKSVDVVHDYFQTLNKSSEDTLRILRLYGRTHERLDFKDPIYELKIDTEDSKGKCKERFQIDALHWKVRQMEDKIVEEKESLFKELLLRNDIPSIEERADLKKTIARLEKEVLNGPYDIILCTCNETCSRRVLSHLKIAQCIVDECGMAHEPETLAVVSLAEHAVLIGDHKQLQPVVRYQPARQCGLTTSLFERYAEMNQKFAVFTKLSIQYRMHRRICEVPSEMYYEGKLVVDESIEKRRPLMESLSSFWLQGNEFPIMFCDVVGTEEDHRNSAVFKGSVNLHSKRNLTEARKTLEIIKCLVDKHHLNSTDCDIAVLTPYTAQKDLVEDLLRKSNDPRIQKVVVSSIIESQGDEYNIVILNTVRSLPLSDIADHRFIQPDSRWMRDNLGFLTDPHQINVGLTRAKYGLIIIGNRVLLNYEKDWRMITKRYAEYGCVVNDSHSIVCS